MTHSESLGNLAAALAAFQAEAPDIPKSKTVKVETKRGRYTFDYAPLEHILKLVRPLMAKHGLALTQQVDGETLVTILMHKSGEFVGSSARLVGFGNDPKEAGGAITYMRRYALCAALGISGDDDVDDPRAGEIQHGARQKGQERQERQEGQNRQVRQVQPLPWRARQGRGSQSGPDPAESVPMHIANLESLGLDTRNQIALVAALTGHEPPSIYDVPPGVMERTVSLAEYLQGQGVSHWPTLLAIVEDANVTLSKTANLENVVNLYRQTMEMQRARSASDRNGRRAPRPEPDSAGALEEGDEQMAN